jgi:hypothetical protein
MVNASSLVSTSGSISSVIKSLIRMMASIFCIMFYLGIFVGFTPGFFAQNQFIKTPVVKDSKHLLFPCIKIPSVKFLTTFKHNIGQSGYHLTLTVK